MGVVAVIEQGREVVHKFGDSPDFTRTIRVELFAPVSAGLLVQLTGTTHGSPHPDASFAKCVDVQVTESLIENPVENPTPGAPPPAIIAATIVAKYEIGDDPGVLPWQRADVWKFQTQGVAVPALFYYDGTTQKPLTNSANDYFEGLLVDEAQQKVTIMSNRQTFPSALAAAVTNCVNDGVYLGFAQDCIKVQGISGERVEEEINGQKVHYWKITSELLARQTGWNLLLPDIGWNYIEGGEKKRASVKGPDGEEIPSANPIGLNGSGGKNTTGVPTVLNRRVYKRISMSSYFGTPPT